MIYCSFAKPCSLWKPPTLFQEHSGRYIFAFFVYHSLFFLSPYLLLNRIFLCRNTQARNRKECIKSSVRVYKRLLRFTPGDSVLPYDVIGALAIDDDGDLDEKRAQSLLHVFLPDKDNTLRQLSFVQSIDYIYKDLRFLRASILNSSKIDSVLEDAFDVIFNGILVIIVMTILGLNPWPLLVSFSVSHSALIVLLVPLHFSATKISQPFVTASIGRR